MSLTRPIAALLLAVGFLIPMIAQTGVIDAKKAIPVAASTETGPAHLGGDLPGDPQIQLVEVASMMPAQLVDRPGRHGRLGEPSNVRGIRAGTLRERVARGDEFTRR